MTDNAGNKTGNKAAYLCKVAGVTFDNPDGESRQQIIKDIIEKHGKNNRWTGPGKLVVTKYVNEREERDEPLIEVHVLGKRIGHVPVNLTEEVSKNPRTQSGSVLVQLSYVQQYGVYSAKLFTPNRSTPTKSMEIAVKRILKNYPNLEPPEYTFDAYRAFLNKKQGGVCEQTRVKVLKI